MGDVKQFRKVYQNPILHGREPDATEKVYVCVFMCIYICVCVRVSMCMLKLLHLSNIFLSLTAKPAILWYRCAKRGRLRSQRSRHWSTILFCGAPTNCCRSTCLQRLYKLCCASSLPSSRLCIKPLLNRRMLCECAKELERPRKWSLSPSFSRTPFPASRACAVFLHITSSPWYCYVETTRACARVTNDKTRLCRCCLLSQPSRSCATTPNSFTTPSASSKLVSVSISTLLPAAVSHIVCVLSDTSTLQCVSMWCKTQEVIIMQEYVLYDEI